MKRILACCLVSISILQSTALAVDYGIENNQEEKTYSQTFADVPTNHWAFEYIEELVDRNVLNGYPDGNFYPNQTVSREAFAKILTLAAGETVTTATTTYFADVPTTLWSAPYINVAQSYMTAYNVNGTLYFKPTESAVREDMAVAIVKMKGYDTSLADLEIIQTMFSDYNQISESAKPYIAIAVEKGVISGFTDGTFKPQATITRAESSAMLWRAFQYGNDDKVVVDDFDLEEFYEDLVETKPEIEEVEPEIEEEFKPYVETLSSYSTSSLISTYDTEGNIYAVENNSIVKYTPSGSKSTLLDGNALNYEFYEHEIGDNSDTIIYFDNVTINDIVYNQGDNTVYFSTNSQSSNSGSSNRYSYNCVFSVDNLNNPIFATTPYYIGNFISSQYTLSLVGTSEHLGFYHNSYSYGSWYEYNSVTKTYSKLSAQKNTTEYNCYNNDLVSLPSLSSNVIKKYNFNTSDWDTYSVINLNYKFKALGVSSESIYITTENSLYSLTPNGLRYDANHIIDFVDVEVFDRTSFSCFTDFIFDNDGNIIFKDTTNNRIRKLTIQE